MNDQQTAVAVGLVTRFTAHSPVAARAVLSARPETAAEVIDAAKLDGKGNPASGTGPNVEAAFENARREISKLKASIATSPDPAPPAIVEQPEPGTGE